MRLLVVSQYFWPENFRINDLVSELVARNHEVVVLTGKPNYPQGWVFPEFLTNPVQFNSYNGARILRAPMLARGQGALSLVINFVSFAVGAALYGLIALRRERFDAILVYEPSPVTVGLPAILFRWLKGWPVAFWVQDQWPETLLAIGAVKSRAIFGLLGKLVSYIYTRCDLILSQSRSLLKPIRLYCKHDQRVEYFPNWAESIFDQQYIERAPEIPLATDTFNIVFAGNIGEAQDFSAILKAAEILSTERHIRWFIVGDGRQATWVREQVAQMGLEDTFVLLGRFPLERMPSFYKHADALLVSLKPDPVFAMTLPGKVQSYLAAGIPIVAMIDGEGAAIIRESTAGFATPAGDAGALAESIRRLSKMPSDERIQMGIRGRDYSSKEFDRRGLVSKLECWLQELSAKQERVR